MVRRPIVIVPLTLGKAGSQSRTADRQDVGDQDTRQGSMDPAGGTKANGARPVNPVRRRCRLPIPQCSRWHPIAGSGLPLDADTLAVSAVDENVRNALSCWVVECTYIPLNKEYAKRIELGRCSPQSWDESSIHRRDSTVNTQLLTITAPNAIRKAGTSQFNPSSSRCQTMTPAITVGSVASCRPTSAKT